MNDPGYVFPLSIQMVLPTDYLKEGFRRKLTLLQEWGFSGLELNITRPEEIDPAALKSLLADYGLQMTMFASGATANAEGLSLSHPDERLWDASVRRCTELMDFAALFRAGVIVGFLKGGLSADPVAARQRFGEAVGRLEAHARAKQVPLLIEATNHYESAVANSLAEAAAFIQGYDNPHLRILPDTYHMNIEERSPFGALARHMEFYDSLHLSDNNRLFPGLGALDFMALLRFLKEVGYEGRVAIEGNVRGSFEEDLRASMSLLQPMLLGV